MDYGRRSARYDDYSPPRHPRGPGAVESTYVRDGGRETQQHGHRRRASDGERSTYRQEHYEIPGPPPKGRRYDYEEIYEVERRRRPAYSQRRPSYSAGPVPRSRNISTSTSYSDERDRQHPHGRRHSHHERKKSSSNNNNNKNPLGLGLDLNWKQAAEAAAGAAAAEAWRSRGNPDKMRRVATAAAGAVAVDLALGRGTGDEKNKRHAMESAIGGVVFDRMVNGSRSKVKR
ncbi:uncharacterized protein PG986_001169 [Apiospora aurea]|uniref:Uncharacterized protein n=1 Tax=Apiospora aurea TaxID=335848 RepID=A0ABR1QW20_9PEZI